MPDIPTRASRHGACALLFVLIVAALVGVEWHMIANVNHEAGDFAANSLLIQDAKRLHLIHGNYSRVGFYHPGPAILYVLAFGELVLHDWLHLVPSPFSGQIVAGILYNAGWLVLIFALMRRFTAAAPALLFVALLVLAAAFDDPSIVTGLWFPNLYFFPYAAMLVAIAPLVHGRADALKALAVASGFLINGHASFVAMLGVILIVVVAANALLSRRDPSTRILSRDWLGRHRRTLLAAAGILFLFFVPLIVATVVEWPGPISDYIHFGTAAKGNTWGQALAFVAVYWGRSGVALALWLGSAAVLVLLLLKGAGAGARADFVRGARGLGVAFLGATAAALYYAKAGVDMLDEVYIELFYYAVPAMCAALLALFAWRALAVRMRDAAAVVLALAALGGSWHWLRQDLVYIYLYDHPRVVELYRQLRALPGSGRIVLDLERDPRTWGEIWGGTLSLQAYAARQHVDLVCINENWHISNTRAARCRPEEVAHNRHYQVRPTGAPDPVLGEPDVEALGLSLYRAGAPARPAAYVTVKDEPGYFKGILGKGWSYPEPEFVWTEGPLAELHLPADPARGRWLALDFGSFVPAGDVILRVQAYANGKPAGTSLYYTSEIRHRFPVDLGADPGAAQHIRIRIEGAVSPQQYHISPDPRQLGLSLYGIRKEPA